MKKAIIAANEKSGTGIRRAAAVPCGIKSDFGSQLNMKRDTIVAETGSYFSGF